MQGGAEMKKIHMFLLLIAAMLVVQMYEPITVCEVQAATDRKSVV